MKPCACWLGVTMIVWWGGAGAVAQSGGALANKPRFTLNDHKDVAWCVAFSPDGKSMATCAGNRDANAGELRGYDLATGKPVRALLAEEPHGIRWLI